MEVLPIINEPYKRKTGLFVDKNYESYASEYDSDDFVVSALSKRLGRELRSAKYKHLSCGQVLLPCDLLQEIARRILCLADDEPYGLRGCTLHLNFEGEYECRKLSTIKCDPSTVSTFELHLTLKQATTGWQHFLPHFIKKFTKGGTVVISSEFTLSKDKLFRSSRE